MQIIKAAKGNINTRHGEQIGRGFPHVGIDIGWGGGTELYAPADGRLTWAWSGSYGNLAYISHPDGTLSRIAHAAEYFGANGREVKQSEHIGTMGRTGGPWGTAGWYVHCHQEYWVDGVAVDPEDYFGAAPAGGGYDPVSNEEEDMKQLNYIFNYDGAIGIVDDGGLLNAVGNVEQYESLARLGLVPSSNTDAFHATRQPDGMVWNALTAFTARIRAAHGGVDLDDAALAALAGQIAPLVLSPIMAAIAEIDGIELTQEQLEAAVNSSIRRVLGSLDEA